MKKKPQIPETCKPHLEALQKAISESRHEWTREERRALYDAIRPLLPLILRMEV